MTDEDWTLLLKAVRGIGLRITAGNREDGTVTVTMPRTYEEQVAYAESRNASSRS